jgi:hypothetical protein
MHLLPASLAILPGGRGSCPAYLQRRRFFPGRRQCRGCRMRPGAASPSRTAPGSDVVRTVRPYLSKARVD